MTNPFDDADGEFYALINEEGQYSLWPTFIDVPAGWTVRHGPAPRQACLDHVEANWTDMRPASLVRAMESRE
jgi:MbtH protein